MLAKYMKCYLPEENDMVTSLGNALSYSAFLYRQPYLGAVLPVLWEVSEDLGSGNWHLEGLTDNYLHISLTAPGNYWNKISPVRLTELSSDGFNGELEVP